MHHMSSILDLHEIMTSFHKYKGRSLRFQTHISRQMCFTSIDDVSLFIIDGDSSQTIPHERWNCCT